MSYENIQLDVGASLLALCKQFIIDEGLRDFQVFDFDTHTVTQDFPDTNLVGVAEYSLIEDEGLYTGHCMFIVSTLQDDMQLSTLKPTVSKLFNRLKSGSTAPVVEMATGLEIGNIKTMLGTEASAVSRTKGRPLQAINVHFGVAAVT